MPNAGAGQHQLAGMRALRSARYPDLWVLAPASAVEFPAAFFRCTSAPLLEEERNSGVEAFVSDVCCPGDVEWAVSGAGLSSGDDPVNALELQRVERTYERFAGEEPDRCRHGAEVVDPVERMVVFDGDAHP